MTNGLKLLMTEDDLHNLKKCSIDLKNFIDTQLSPAQNSIAGEATRLIKLHRKIDGLISEGNKIIAEIQVCLGEVK